MAEPKLYPVNELISYKKLTSLKSKDEYDCQYLIKMSNSDSFEAFHKLVIKRSKKIFCQLKNSAEIKIYNNEYIYNYITTNNESLLHLAALRGNALIVNNILDGKKIYHIDGKGMTPLHYAANAGRNEIVEILLEKGYSETYNYNDDLPSDLAKRNKYKETYEILIKHHNPPY